MKRKAISQILNSAQNISGVLIREPSEFYLTRSLVRQVYFYHVPSLKPRLTRFIKGLHFNSRSESCDYPANVNCGKISTTQPESGSKDSKKQLVVTTPDAEKAEKIDIKDLLSSIGQLKDIVNSLLTGNISNSN